MRVSTIAVFRPNAALRGLVLNAWIAACLCVSASTAFGQAKPVLRTDVPPALAERLLKEGEARDACKRAICEVARKKATAPLACKVVKTWPQQDLKDKILKGKLDWTWGNAQCEANIQLDPAKIAEATGAAKSVLKVAKHKVSCNLEKDGGVETHKLTFAIEPEVTFEKGKAVKAVLHWSEVDGTTLAKTALWSATAVDNTFNVLQGVVVEQINEFFGPKCDDAVK